MMRFLPALLAALAATTSFADEQPTPNVTFERDVRPILKAGLAPLQVLGAVLGVLQVALALQIILMSLHRLGIIPSSGLLPG